MSKIVQLIFTKQRRGLGKDTDPIRKVPQLWTLDGKLVAELDSQEIVTENINYLDNNFLKNIIE